VTIEFWAIVAKIQTLADGGIRLYLDLPEDAIMQVAELMTCKRHEVVLDVTCKQREEGRDGAQKENGRKVHI